MSDDVHNQPPAYLPYADELKTRLPYAESRLRVAVSTAVGAASTCWENLEGAGVFESEKASKIAEDLCEEIIKLTTLGEPSLGCATNAQLLEELRARIQMSPDGLEYRTVDAD